MGPPPPSFDYYAELEVSKSASAQEITTAYRRLARVHHPDKNPGQQDAATNKFQKIQLAYETLSSPAGRRRYDTFPTGRHTCACGHCFEDEYGDGPYDSEYDDDDEDYYYDFAFGPGPGAGPRPFFSSGYRSGGFTFGGSRFRSYEDMEKFFQEQERKELERQKILEEERRQKEEAEAARKQAKEAAKKAEEDAIQKKKDEQHNAERIKQEERWTKAGAITKDEKLAICLHSDFCAKVPQRKKFKCGTCKKKGGMTAFECPFCASFLCQQCVVNYSERRAKGEDIHKLKAKHQTETPPLSESETESIQGTTEEEASPEPELGPVVTPPPDAEAQVEPEIGAKFEQTPTSDKLKHTDSIHAHNRGGVHKDVEDKYGAFTGPATKKSKKNKKTSQATQASKSSTSEAEPPISIPGVKVNGTFGHKVGSKRASPVPNGLPFGTPQKSSPVSLQKQQPQTNGIHEHAPNKPLIPPGLNKVRPQMNGSDSRVPDRTAPSPKQIIPEATGIPGLEPFPPPAPDPLPINGIYPNGVNGNDLFNPPTAPASMARARKPFVGAPRVHQVSSCYICGQTGHLARNCSQPRSCYNCGGSGHLAKFCNKNNAASQRQAAESTDGPDPRAAYFAPPVETTKAAIRGATLAKGITEPLLRQAMESFGPITECIIDRRAGIAWTVFVESESLQNAIAASPVSVAKGAVRITEWTGHE